MHRYKVNVPVNCMNLDALGRDKVLEELKKLDAKRVFLNFEEALDSGGIYFKNQDRHIEQMKKLREAAEFFKDNGFEVVAWFWAFMADKELGFTQLCDLKGKEISSFACPSDKNFVDFAAECVADVARCGVDMIVFNDDFRYGFFSDSPACLCENHVKRICDIVGEDLTREELTDKITSGAENKYRNAWLKTNSECLSDFAIAVRDKVNTVNPSTRIGFCACMSSWDLDGDAYKLAKLLAGDTRPFVRLIGAPYWAVNKSWGNRLQDVIELTRMEVSYFHDDIELVAEGDVWPRPRTQCPASFLEGYDTALRASGQLDGILKIALDYTARADYETGYSVFHQRNKELYGKIETAFADKQNVGVRVYEYAEKIRKMQIPNGLGEVNDFEMQFFSEAARTLSCNGIPTVYEGSGGYGIAFGENARYVPEEALKNGMIIDTAAAYILSQRGIDTGIKAFGEKIFIDSEQFVNNSNRIIAFSAPSYNIELEPNAEILSFGISKAEKIPFSFTYKNSNGGCFLVINTNPAENNALMRHYARASQYVDFLGDCFYAHCIGHPDLYMLCSEGKDGLAVGLWNFCIDPVINPVAKLGKEYSSIEFINGSGELCGKSVELSEIPPYGFVGFVVSNIG